MKFQVLGITQKVKANPCDVSLIFQEKEKETPEYQHNEPIDTAAWFINPDAYALTGMDKSSMSNADIVAVIKHIVCSKRKVSYVDILGKSRKRKVVVARQLFHFFAKKLTQLSLSDIGFETNNDHSTVLNSIKVINDLCDTEPMKMVMVTRLECEISQRVSIKVSDPSADTINNWNQIKHKYITHEE